MSELDVGGIVVKVEASRQCTVIWLLRDSDSRAVYQNGI
jgi:hypothetical protein